MSRVERLRQRRMQTFSEEMFASRRTIFSRVYQEYSGEPKILKKAKAIAAFLGEKGIFLEEDDLIAGYQQTYDYFNPDPEDFSLQSIRDLIRKEDLEQSTILEDFEKGYRIGLFIGGLGGHVIADFDELLKRGFGDLRREAEEKLKGGDTYEKFYSAIVTVCDGVETYIRRYVQKARLLAEKTRNERYRRELERIAESCEWVASEPPRTFFEALQLLWLAIEVWTIEQASGSLSLGRFDQYIFPFYQRDMEQCRITREEAKELIEVLWIKFNVPASTGSDYRIGPQLYQNIVIGGQKADCTDATNEISYICLEATEKLRLNQPLLTLRYHSGTAEEFLGKACRVLRKGGGLPALFNDDLSIRAKERLGIDPKDARNYGIVGCVEISVPGKEFAHTEGLRLNWAKVLELMLNNGICTISGEKMKNEGKAEFVSFEDLYNTYKDELAHFVDLGAKGLSIQQRWFHHCCPYPYTSAIMRDCIEIGKDVAAGGVTYNLLSINGCGMANVADSLAAIKKLVFEEKIISLRELTEALRNNFCNNEVLRQKLINKAPKYGNDDDYADRFIKELSELFCMRVMKHKNVFGGKFQAGLYTVHAHALLGQLTGALPDGRLSGVSLSNGLSPSQGRDTTSPTAVIKSITKFDHSLMGNGMVLDLRFDPSVLSGEEGLEKFKHLVKTYFALGGMEIQFNVVGRETLIKAQKSPEDYQDLIVRVSGFSAYFTQLYKSLQDEIIRRTEYSF